MAVLLVFLPIRPLKIDSFALKMAPEQEKITPEHEKIESEHEKIASEHEKIQLDRSRAWQWSPPLRSGSPRNTGSGGSNPVI
ncbi:MAG: hypothetical protein QOE77_2161 [Blastocatellia bacterium]|nr:hypothetical protein [Blastocatellia bacterium]